MGCVNRVMLLGYLGRDLEVRATANGTLVGTMSVATTDVWRDRNGQKQERTDWHRVVVWGETVESLREYLSKGQQVFVEGRLGTREWVDEQGQRRWMTEVTAQRVVLVGRRPEPGQPRRSTPQEEPANRVEPVTVAEEDDIPF